jgi:hypothetical protein
LELTKLSGKNLLPELPASRILKTSDEGVVEVRIFSDYTLLSEINKCLGGEKRTNEEKKPPVVVVKIQQLKGTVSRYFFLQRFKINQFSLSS